MTTPLLPDPRAEWEPALAALRSQGWSLAVHNDYVQDGRLRTFWLFTRKGGASLKGEGVDDAAALAECLGPVPPDAPAGGGAAAVLSGLRRDGWQVALHNDYRLDGRSRTFWRLVHPASRRYVDGEGDTDLKALLGCMAQVASHGA